MSNNQDNSSASDGQGSSKETQQPLQQVKGKEIEISPTGSETPESSPELTKLSLEDIKTTESSSSKTDTREKIRKICENEKPLMKKLQKNDISLERLELPEEDFDAIILPVLNRDKKNKIDDGIAAYVYDEDCREYEMILQYIPESKSYHLHGEWNKFCTLVGLKANEHTVTMRPLRDFMASGLYFYIEALETIVPETMKTETPSPEGPSEKKRRLE